MQSSSLRDATYTAPLLHLRAPSQPSHDEQFSMAAAYLASLQPPPPPSRPPYERPAPTQSPDWPPPSSSTPSLFDSHVTSCLSQLHSSSLAPPPSELFHPSSAASHLLGPMEQPQLYEPAHARHGVAGSRRNPFWQFAPCVSIEASVQQAPGYVQTAQSVAMAPVVSLQSHAASMLDMSSSLSFNSSPAASLSVSVQSSAEPFSVPPSQYPLSRAESASLCSTDSSSSYRSSSSSVHSPVSPPRQPQPPAYLGELQSASAYPAAVPLHVSHSTSSESITSLASTPLALPLDDANDQSVSSLRLPPYIYPSVQSAISAALQHITPTSSGSSVSLSADKRRGEQFDSERRIKHRIIDANRRERESVLVERFAQLSGQRHETLSRDRVSTLEVACDRYEELTRVVEAMKDRMRRMEERLHARDSPAAPDEAGSSRRKSKESRRAARARSEAQHSSLERRPKQSPVQPQPAAVSDKCEVTLSDDESS